MTKKEGRSFEEALGGLENTVEALERGDLPLEESIRTFEEGVALAAECAKILKASDVRVRKLVARARDAFDLEPMDAADGRSAGEEAQDA